MKSYEEATKQIAEAFSEISNKDVIRLIGGLVMTLSELEGSEYFCLDTNGEVKVVLLSGRSAKHIAKLVKDRGFKEDKCS